MNTNTASTVHGADHDGHNGYVVGIFEQDGIYTALGGCFSRDFKTLRGATAYLARFGYNADGTRI